MVKTPEFSCANITAAMAGILFQDYGTALTYNTRSPCNIVILCKIRHIRLTNKICRVSFRRLVICGLEAVFKQIALAPKLRSPSETSKILCFREHN